MTYFVARYAYDAIRARKQDRPASTHIEGNYNTVINVLSERIHIPVSQIEDALRDTLPPTKRRSLIKSVTKFLRPRSDGVVSPIEVQGVGDVGTEVINEYPSDADLSEIDETRNLDIQNASLNIRATDKDRSKTGWAAVIQGDGRFRKRLPMDLYPTVDAESLAHRDSVVGDIIVEGERKPDGTFRGKRIHLLSVRDGGEPLPSPDEPK